MRYARGLEIAAALLLSLAGCKGSSSSGDVTPPSYRVGGTIQGVTGTGLVLQNNGGDDLPVAAGANRFSFATALRSGAPYAVTVKTHPTGPTQSCSVVGGTGTVGTSDVSSVVVTCTDVRYLVGGTIRRLVGTGLVLQNNGGDDLTVPAGATSFQFAGSLAAGAGYDVTIRTQPASPGQTCSVDGGAGTVGSANVTSVIVTCSEVPRYRIGGTVSGLSSTGLVLQDNGGDDLTVAAGATWFEFASSLATGSAYDVTVRTQPTSPAQSCSVTGGTGTVASADVSTVAVTCVDTVVQRWTAPTTWGARWAPSDTMVQHAWFDGAQIVEAASTGISWTVANGAAPAQREFKGFPSGSRWGAGPFTGQRYQATGDGAVGALTGDLIVCALVKPDYDPTIDPTFGIGHEKPIIAKGVTEDRSTIAGGGWALTQTRESFTFHYTYLAHSDGRTVHVFVSVPTFFATHAIGTDGDPDSVRYQQNSGPLDPSYVVFCGGRTQNKIFAVVNGVALDYVLPDLHYPGDTGNVASIQPGPPYTVLDAGSHPLTIGGYDTGDTTKVFGGRVYETAIWAEPGTPANIQEKVGALLGLNLPGARYVRNREAPFYGADAVPGTPAAGYHTAWHDGPRIDAARGFLFGLQAWNRVSGYSYVDSSVYIDPLQPRPFIFAAGDDMGLEAITSVVRPDAPGEPRGDTSGWTPLGAATVAATGTVQPPGDSEQVVAKRVTLPPGAALRAPLRGFASAGPLHGQIWLRRPAGTTGTLRIETGYSTTLGSNTFDVVLGALPQDTWQRVWLYRSPGGFGNELFTSGGANTVSLEAPLSNSGPISFYAWGLALTQVGTAVPADASDPVAGGVALGALDLGAEMYDWSASKDALNAGAPDITVDALQLPPVPRSTAATGFCLSFEGTMPANLPWSAPFTASRTALAWVDDPAAATATARIYLSGATNTPQAPGRLCFAVTGAPAPLCAAIPASFTAGSTHRVTACMSPAGSMRLHADGNATPLATAAAGVAAPELAGGTLLVGGASVLPVGDPSPWHGYVSKAVVCRSTTDVGGCD